MVMGRYRVLLLLLFGLMLFGCRERGEAAPQVLLKVNGREVSHGEFQERFAKSLPQDQQLGAEERAELERAFLVRIVDRELILAEAERLAVSLTAAELAAAEAEARSGYPEEEFRAGLKARGLDEKDWRRELEESLLMEKVARLTVYDKIEVSDDEVAAYYREHAEEFAQPEQVRARQILVADEAEGQRLLAELRAGADFGELARRHSLSPDGEEGGDLGFFAQEEMPPEIDTAVWGMATGDLSGLVRSEYGYHLFQVLERRPALQLSLEEAREKIRARSRERAEEEAYQEWLRGLREQAAISINWSLFD